IAGQTGSTSTSIFISASPTATAHPSATSSGLSSGVIAGIVVGLVGVLLALGASLLLFFRKRQRIFQVPATSDAENTVKAPSYAFSPGPSSVILPPRREFTELSGSSDPSTAECRAQYVRSPNGPESLRH